MKKYYEVFFWENLKLKSRTIFADSKEEARRLFHIAMMNRKDYHITQIRERRY